MGLSMILARAMHGVIGRDNALPWNIPEDLKYFRSLTLHHSVVMGRKTCESLLRPLLHRKNWVLSRSHRVLPEGFSLISVDQVLEQSVKEEVFIIGGDQIFRLFYPLAQKIYLTEIHAAFLGDTYFRLPVEQDFDLVSERQQRVASGWDVSYQVWQRR